jgi:hypothetical protein
MINAEFVSTAMLECLPFNQLVTFKLLSPQATTCGKQLIAYYMKTRKPEWKVWVRISLSEHTLSVLKYQEPSAEMEAAIEAALPKAYTKPQMPMALPER